MSILDALEELENNVYRVNEHESGGLMKHMIQRSLDDAVAASPDAEVVAGPVLSHGESRTCIFRLQPLGRFGPTQNGRCSLHIMILDGAKTLASALAIQIGENYISRLTHDMTVVVDPDETYALKNCNTQSYVDIAIMEAVQVQVAQSVTGSDGAVADSKSKARPNVGKPNKAARRHAKL